MKKKTLIATLPVLVCLLLFFSRCDLLQGIQGTGTTGSSDPTNAEIISGLKEALNSGVTKGVTQLNLRDGFFKDLAIKILFPDEAKKVENTLRSLGMGSVCDQAIESFNRAAEGAMLEAKPIFANAITSMTFTDAMNILLGSDDAATVYFKSKTSAQLSTAFKPKIQTSLDKVSATKYWSDIMTTYNNLPTTQQKINPDLAQFVTDKAIDGLFVQVKKEEAKIRQTLSSRTSPLLKKVFAYMDKKKGKTPAN